MEGVSKENGRSRTAANFRNCKPIVGQNTHTHTVINAKLTSKK